MRFAPTVHGEGNHGFVATLVDVARAKGASGYVGDGSNRWPAVHRADASRMVRLALAQAPAGSVVHGVAEEGVPARSIAEVIGRHLDVPVVSVEPPTPPSTSVGSAGLLARYPGVEHDHASVARLDPPAGY